MIIKPNFPTNPDNPEGFWEGLASVGLLPSDLKSLCIEVVEVQGISSVEDNTVIAYYDGDRYENVPVYIHTDKGVSKDNPLTSELFEDAALHFIFSPSIDGQSSDFNKASRWDNLIGDWDEGFSYDIPEAYALVYQRIEDVPTGSSRVFAIVRVKSHLNLTDASLPIRAFPSYRMLLSIEMYYSYSYRRCVLLDIITGDIAMIPNDTFTELIEADYGEYFLDYSHIFGRDVDNNYDGVILCKDYAYGGVYDIYTISSGNSCDDPVYGSQYAWTDPNSCVNGTTVIAPQSEWWTAVSIPWNTDITCSFTDSFYQEWAVRDDNDDMISQHKDWNVNYSSFNCYLWQSSKYDCYENKSIKYQTLFGDPLKTFNISTHSYGTFTADNIAQTSIGEETLTVRINGIDTSVTANIASGSDSGSGYSEYGTIIDYGNMCNGSGFYPSSNLLFSAAAFLQIFDIRITRFDHDNGTTEYSSNVVGDSMDFYNTSGLVGGTTDKLIPDVKQSVAREISDFLNNVSFTQPNILPMTIKLELIAVPFDQRTISLQ